MEARVREREGWGLVERGGDGTRSRVLMLPGLFCTHRFYELLVQEPALAEGGVATLAADPPGFAGRGAPAGFDYSVEAYAELVAALAAAESIDLIVAHSYFANVTMEMASRGAYRGALMLLSPCLRPESEERDLRQLDRVGRVPLLGTLAWLAVYPTLKGAMKGRLPEDRLDELVAEMKRNPQSANKQITTRYFDHLRHHGNLSRHLTAATQSVWVVRGDQDEVGFDDEDRQLLERLPNVEVRIIPGARHFSMLDAPSTVAELITEQLTSASR
jgi:pimeloyl-ACP methyl ester carboxylesterase